MSSIGHEGLILPSVSPDVGSFYGRLESEIPELFKTLQIPMPEPVSLDAVVELTQPWVKGDHGLYSYDFSLTVPQRAELREQFDRFDMTEQRDLPAGHYDQILVFGAVHLGNDKRLQFLSEMLTQGDVTTDQVVLLGGERKMDKREPEDIVRNLESLEARGEVDPWLEHIMEKPAKEVDESDMLRIAAMDHLGPLALRRQLLHIGLEDMRRTSTPTTQYDFTRAGDPTNVTLLHTRAVSRKDGEWRHTTEECMRDLARRDILVDNPDAKIAIIGSQPHLERMEKTTLRILRQMDIRVNLVAGGPGVGPQTGETIFLGEVARNLYEDQQARDWESAA